MKRSIASPGLTGIFIPDRLLARHDLSAGAKVVYSAFAQLEDGRGVAEAHLQVIGGETGMAEEDVARCLVELERHGLIRLKKHAQVQALMRCTFLDQAPAEARRGGGSGGQANGRRPLSKYSRKVCQWFTERLIQEGKYIWNVQRFTDYLYWKGEVDDRIASALAEAGENAPPVSAAATVPDSTAQANDARGKKAAA
ncbi:MAG TPA: hypothetical protein VF546_04660 [Pyrinomonadaceae bacterium]|jgi:hypothetical protein